MSANPSRDNDPGDVLIESRRSRSGQSRSDTSWPPPEWPFDEIQDLRAKVCTSPPDPRDSYWKSNAVWVGCVNVEGLKTCNRGAAARDLQVKIKAISKAGDIWSAYKKREAELEELIRGSIGGTRIKIVQIKVSKGSVEIIIVIAIGTIALKLGLGALILGILEKVLASDKARTVIHDAAVDAAAFINKLTYRLRSWFQGFFNPPLPE